MSDNLNGRQFGYPLPMTPGPGQVYHRSPRAVEAARGFIQGMEDRKVLYADDKERGNEASYAPPRNHGLELEFGDGMYAGVSIEDAQEEVGDGWRKLQRTGVETDVVNPHDVALSHTLLPRKVSEHFETMVSGGSPDQPVLTRSVPEEFAGDVVSNGNHRTFAARLAGVRLPVQRSVEHWS